MLLHATHVGATNVRVGRVGWFQTFTFLLQSGFTLNFAGKIGPAWTNLMECMRSEPGCE